MTFQRLLQSPKVWDFVATSLRSVSDASDSQPHDAALYIIMAGTDLLQLAAEGEACAANKVTLFLIWIS